MTEILADTHVHLYSTYDLSRAFENAWQNFQSIASSPASHCVLYLTERSNCFYFRELAARRSLVDGFEVEQSAAPQVLHIKRRAGGEMALVAGRQIGSAGRTEVLALYTLSEFEDGMSIEASVDAAKASGAVVVLNWSLGKWMFARGKQIESLISSRESGNFLLGDISGRPAGWGMPRLLKKGLAKGFRAVEGSDPLPFPGEEKQLAAYVTRISGANESDLKTEGFYRNLLLSPQFTFQPAGRRNSPILAVKRLWNNRVQGRPN